MTATPPAADHRAVLLDDPAIRIEHLRGEAPAARLMVVFAPWGGGTRSGDGWLRKAGFDLLSISSSSNDWYQSLSGERLAGIVAALPRYRRVVAMGSGMGGYAAHWFADALGAAVAIGLSPQYSVDPALMPEETRWAADSARIAFRHAPLAPAPGSAVRHAVVWDPRDPDDRHARRILAALPGSTALPVPFGGHPVDLMLAEAGALEPLVRMLANGRVPVPAQLLRRRKGRSPAYLAGLARACDARRRTALADRLYERATRKDDRPDLLVEYSRFLLHHGRHRRALAVYERARPLLVVDGHLHAFHGLLLESCGEPRAALAAYRASIDRDPSFAAFYVNERRVLGRMEADQRRRIAMLEAQVAKLQAEQAMRTDPPAPRPDARMIATILVVPPAVALVGWLLARMSGLI